MDIEHKRKENTSMKTIETGTLTAAQRARAILVNNNINCAIRKRTGTRGCTYYIEIRERDYERAIALLRRARIV